MTSVLPQHAPGRTPTDSSAPGPVIEAEDLTFRYGDREALRGISFSVRRGEVLAVLGPNGGGKSTLFRILSTLVPPGGGRLSILGRDAVRETAAIRNGIGVVFQAPSLDRYLSARENLLHQGHLYGLRGRNLSARIEAALDRAELTDRAGERVDRFSGGLRRRLEIAKALLHEPELLILDEPSTGLDPGIRRSLWDRLHRIRETSGTTIIFTTHLMDEAERSDRVALLDAGRLVGLDRPRALMDSVGGNVILVESDDPATLLGDIRERFQVVGTTVGDRVRIESKDGHELAARIATAWPEAVRATSVGRPTLEDAFLHLTGRTLVEAEAAGEPGAGSPPEGGSP